MKQRNTIQKMLIIDAVKSSKEHPTAEQIYSAVAEKCPNISRGTVYRNLNLLASEGDILRVPVPNGPDRFDSTTRPHCHCCCLDCGRVYDYELPHGVELGEEMNQDFLVRDYELMINGWCRECRKNNEEVKHG